MPTQEAAAALTAEIFLEAQTGFIYRQQGYLDATSGTIKPTGSSTWVSLTSWQAFQNYQQVTDQILWTAPLIDLGSIQNFCLDISAEFTGTISYLIHVSDTGLFQGEETEYLVEEGDTDVSSFRGQFVYVTARLQGDELIRLTITSNTETKTIELFNIDTSTLSGTITNRVIPVSNISGIVDIIISPQVPTAYAVNLYVSDTPTSEVLIPMVRSKNMPSPTFALFGIDNDARNGVVDILIKALPRQAMIGGNLRVL
jgi:hypothetical protein